MGYPSAHFRTLRALAMSHERPSRAHDAHKLWASVPVVDRDTATAINMTITCTAQGFPTTSPTVPLRHARTPRVRERPAPEHPRRRRLGLPTRYRSVPGRIRSLESTYAGPRGTRLGRSRFEGVYFPDAEADLADAMTCFDWISNSFSFAASSRFRNALASLT